MLFEIGMSETESSLCETSTLAQLHCLIATYNNTVGELKLTNYINQRNCVKMHDVQLLFSYVCHLVYGPTYFAFYFISSIVKYYSNWILYT